MIDDPFEHLPPMTPEEVERVRERAMAVPISSALGLQLLGLNRGVCKMMMTRDPKFDGIFDSLHGGFLMTLADSAAAFALLTVIPADEVITTTEMNIRFLAPVHERVTVTARVLKAGRTLCPIVAELHDEDGRLVAHAGMTYMRLDPAARGGGS
ncbi:MAG: PaaI family thioesterase [Candidatus Eisenbacteria bacterium]